MNARVMTRVAASALVLLFLAANQRPIQAEPVPMPTSKLLLPYFEVSIDSSYEEVTHFSVSNWSSARVDIKAIVYTNWAIPVLEVPMFLNPRQVRSVDLRSWLLRGKLLGNKTVCADGGDDCDEILHLQAALTGRRSPVDRLYYSSETTEGIASGFVILTVMGGAGTHDAIWGEYSYTQPDSRAAEGERLVRLTEGSTCGGDLCQRRALRFRERGALDENTKISIWSWNGDDGQPSRTPQPPFDLGHLEIDVYDEQGRLIEVVPQLATLPSQVLDLAEWDLGKPYGWLDLRSSEPSAIAGVYHLADNFGFALSSWCLPCDPCDPEGVCYDPENATCRTECVAARIKPIGGSTGVVGVRFDLTLDMVGSEPLAMKVSDLPRGLRLEGYRIVGTPMVPGSFTVKVSNECADDVLKVTIVDQPGTLTLIKKVINDDGGTAAASDFELFVDHSRVLTGVANEFFAGTYRASERNLPGYQAGTWSGDCAPDGTVVLENGEHKTCVIVNDDLDAPPPARLTLIKKVFNRYGGNATVADFPLFVESQRVTSGVAIELQPGTYRASEQNRTGYLASAWGRDCAADGRVTLIAGDNKVCEITNSDLPASLTLIKKVVNRHGGTAGVSDFVLLVDSQRVTSGVGVALAAGSYRASEQNLPGYVAGAWTGHCAADGRVTLGLGEHKVCEIINSDSPASLTLIKRVINDDGGTAQVADFELFISGQRAISGVPVDLAAGSYRASEQNLPGYEASSWSGDCAADGRVTLALGQHKTCEITNDDRPSSLTLIKRVINNDGGTAVVSDFKLFVDGQQVTSGVAKKVPAGTYRASEQNLPGYQAGAWTGHCASDGSVTIALGEHKVCEITNDDRPSSLTLIKRVINNDGGTAVVSDFKLFVDGQQVSSGVAKTVLAGSHRASEQNLPGYQAGAWTGHCAADGSVTIALGEHKVCEITNDDIPRPCEEINPPQQSISSGRVEFNNPHQSSHWVKVSFNYQIQGAFNGEVQIFWRNGGSTYIKERQTIQRSCQSGQRTGSLQWTSTSQSHHPGHGAEYFARFVSSSGQVLQSIPLN